MPLWVSTDGMPQTRRAVAGRSLLTSASKLLSPSAGLSYGQFETVMAFAVAYVLHDGITVLATPPPPNSGEDRFTAIVNERRPGAIDFLELSDSDRSIVDLRMAELTERVLGQRVTTGDIDISIDFRRDYVEDVAPFRADVQRAVAGRSGGLEDSLRDGINRAWEHGADRIFANHLMRAFMFSSIAHLIGGSAVFTGHRRAVRLLLDEAAPDLHYETTALGLYRAADAALAIRQPNPDPQSLNHAFLAGLIPWIVMRSGGFETHGLVQTGLGEDRGGLRLGHLLARLDRLRESWRWLLALGAKYDAAEVWRPWRNPRVGHIRASARRREAERMMARLAHRQPFSMGERFVQTARDVLGGQQTVSGLSSTSGDDGGVIYPVQVLLNILSLALPGNIDRRLAFLPVLSNLARTNSWPPPSRAAFDLFRIETVSVGGRPVPRDQSEITWSNTLSYSEAQLRLKRLLPERGLDRA